MNCKHCETAKMKASGTYDFKCQDCRNRFIKTEPCKFYRRILVNKFSFFGEFTEWKEGDACGCVKSCQRKARIEQQD